MNTNLVFVYSAPFDEVGYLRIPIFQFQQHQTPDGPSHWTCICICARSDMRSMRLGGRQSAAEIARRAALLDNREMRRPV